MATVQSLVRNLSVQHDGDPAAVVTALNRSLLQCMPANRFATLFYGLFDDTNRTLSYVNAGHNPPFCVRRDGARERLTTGGMMVGVFGDATFVASSTTLHPGDRVIAFTDGLSEATDAGGDQFGDERIADLIGLSPDLDPLTLIDLLLKTRDEFASAEGEPDDTTVVALRARP
jgi:sigma-B regulation protein RsbU (phosphoserine phosphatase)